MVWTTEVALVHNRTYAMSFRIVRPDGLVRVVHDRADVVCDDTGKPVRVSGTVQDITGRKRAEEALRESGERLRRAHRMATLGYWEWHLERNGMRLSPEVVSILRIPPEELPPGFAEYAKLVHPDDRDRYSAVVEKAVNGQGEYEAPGDQPFAPDGGPGHVV